MIEDALLWTIHHPSRDKVHYLFGTMHLQPLYASGLTERLIPYMETCDVLACEANIRELADRNDEIQDITRSPVKMSSHFSEKHYLRMQKYLMRFTGLELDALDHLRPLFAQQLISEYMLNMERTVSLDQLLWKTGQELNLECTGLESVDTQLEYILEIDLDQQFSMFRNWAKHLSKHREYLNRVIEWYRRQNIRTLYHISRDSLGAARKLLIYRRNRRMTEAFIGLADSSQVFAAVGAAHLYGYQGMLRLLKHEGFKPRACSTTWSIARDIP